jgi:hypothetical protein
MALTCSFCREEGRLVTLIKKLSIARNPFGGQGEPNATPPAVRAAASRARSTHAPTRV